MIGFPRKDRIRVAARGLGLTASVLALAIAAPAWAQDTPADDELGSVAEATQTTGLWDTAHARAG